MPDLGSVHIDQPLTTLSLQYKNRMYVADRVWPILSVNKRSDKYFIYDLAMMITGAGLDSNGNPLSTRAPKAEAMEDDFTISNDQYYAKEIAHRRLVTDAERKYADDPLDPDYDTTQFLTNKILLDNEMAVAFRTCLTTNYATANKKTLVSGAGTNPGDTSWAQYTATNSSPFINLIIGKNAVIGSIFQEPNMFLVTIDAARILSQHPLYRDQFKYVSAEGLTASGLQPVINGLRVVEGGGKKNTAPYGLGTTVTAGNIWVNENAVNVGLIYYTDPDNTGPRSIHFGRTFEAPDDTTNTRGVATRRYRWEPKKGEYIETSTLRDWKAVALDASSKYAGGYLLSDVIA